MLFSAIRSKNKNKDNICNIISRFEFLPLSKTKYKSSKIVSFCTMPPIFNNLSLSRKNVVKSRTQLIGFAAVLGRLKT